MLNSRYAEVEQSFQFHKGTIRTYHVLLALHDVSISIP